MADNSSRTVDIKSAVGFALFTAALSAAGTFILLKRTLNKKTAANTNKDSKVNCRWSREETQLREDLAAAYRIADLYSWGGDIIYNHISVRIPGTATFLINPFGYMYDEITASSLVKVDLDGNILDKGTGTGLINRAGFVLHSAIHEGRSDAHCVMHFHQPSGMAVSSLKSGLLPMTQDACLLGEIGYHPFEGIAVSLDERTRIIKDLGPKNKVLLLQSHGLVTIGETVMEATVWMYWLAKACEAQVQAMAAAGGDISRLHMNAPEMRAKCNEQFRTAFTDVGIGVLEFEALKRKIDSLDPSYKD